MEEFQYNEEDRWSQATWSQATFPQVSQVGEVLVGGTVDQKVSETSQSPDSGPSPTLLIVPPNIRAIRDQVFCIKEDITWSAEEFSQYWGYMDNFWILNSTRPIKDGKQTLNFPAKRPGRFNGCFDKRIRQQSIWLSVLPAANRPICWQDK